MRKLLILTVLFFIAFPSFSKNTEKLDVDNASFSDFSRYITTLEINEADSDDNSEKHELEDIDEDEIIIDVAERYEKNAVFLNMDDNADSALSNVNKNRIFSLKVNETQYRIENSIKNENMIWDSSKSFSQAFINNSRHMAPIPSVINSQSLTAKVSPTLTASLGQPYLYDSTGHSLLFIRANESTYNTGSVISYMNNGLNFSVGSFSSSYNHAASGGAILSLKPLKLPYNSGTLSFGGGYIANEEQYDDKITGGGFAEYKYKRLKLNAQVGQSKYSGNSDLYTSFYFTPELKLSDSFYLKTRFIRNLSQDTMQDELALTYKPKNNNNNFEFEINASNQYTQNSNIKQRIKFTTSFRI